MTDSDGHLPGGRPASVLALRAGPAAHGARELAAGESQTAWFPLEVASAQPAPAANL